MTLDFATIDVFTKTPFRGNALAIVHVPAGVTLAQEQKQSIAREFNFSESVFLHEQTPEDIQAGQARLDIFTPIAEVPFAGHPTVGTANYITHYLKATSAKTLVTKAGLLPFQPHGDGIQLAVAHDVRIHNQPFAGRDFGHFPVVSIVKGMTFILAKQPDLETLGKQTGSLLGGENTYTSFNVLDEGYRVGIISTKFYVDLGVDETGTRQLRTRMISWREDPGTGSASAALCAYLSLSEKNGPLTRKYQVTQGVEMGKQSDISLQVTVNESHTAIEEILLSGSAIKVSEGKIAIPPH
ncbi:phenazine biosynthesis protein-like protein phzf family [Xylariaceae sp. FL1272]|nr:phenazine biosynthesis protein-like protein phzf family [Xylariaceae sp. FL1272]